MYKKYITEEAPKQINISGRVRESIRAQVDGATPASSQAGRLLFAAAQEEVFELMRTSEFPSCPPFPSSTTPPCADVNTIRVYMSLCLRACLSVCLSASLSSTLTGTFPSFRGSKEHAQLSSYFQAALMRQQQQAIQLSLSKQFMPGEQQPTWHGIA